MQLSPLACETAKEGEHAGMDSASEHKILCG